ncbi:DNA cytosine methyltransferase [Aliiroseovarius sp. PrR006]|uniref:DNA cytosine methyltransferase n=1 Tax=Aliiroseovarius sp. PrR006 TaxID=2706883 RepID=UPI0013D40ABD|nr:DNA cytosine methyltransferase [Aliiroseovarius sp. PrR006]NDW53613.1 DNA cytosine methyltransferase [Aliiroseovarius sp. PrR006]
MSSISVLEICAGAGGQALGLEQAGFATAAAVEIDADACNTLRLNRPGWTVVEADLKEFSAHEYDGVDLLAGGVPCPPFSVAGKQLGADDERDLFPAALRLARECKPKAVMLENVRGLSSSRFVDYRRAIIQELGDMGYEAHWELLRSSDYGVPQLRPRFVLVALKREISREFNFPKPLESQMTVAAAIGDLMAAEGWGGVEEWRKKAAAVAPTIVGGSKKHGGADLGPTRAKRQWAELGVDGKGIANEPPNSSHAIDHLPRLTLRMAARIQGFPDHWEFSGGKTSKYRQIGNAFPPPVARSVGQAIAAAIRGERVEKSEEAQMRLALAAE